MPGLVELGQLRRVQPLAQAHAPSGPPSPGQPPHPQSIPHERIIQALLEKRARGY